MLCYNKGVIYIFWWLGGVTPSPLPQNYIFILDFRDGDVHTLLERGFFYLCCGSGSGSGRIRSFWVSRIRIQENTGSGSFIPGLRIRNDLFRIRILIFYFSIADPDPDLTREKGWRVIIMLLIASPPAKRTKLCLKKIKIIYIF